MNEQRLNIYPGREKSYEIEMERLEKAKLSARNKELIVKFHNCLFSKGSGAIRVAKLSAQLRRMCPKISKNLDRLTKSDLAELTALYSRDTSLADNTKADYRRTLKQFYRWFKDEDLRLRSQNADERDGADKFYRFIEKDLKTGYKQLQADPNTIISDEDCNIVVENGCRTPREKAFIAMLHETGCRIGEFENIHVGDIVVKDDCAEIVVDGKTGKRPVFCVKSLPHLLRYIEVHPYKKNSRSWLWLSEAQNNRNEPLLYTGAQKLVNRCFERADVSKKHNLHWFRHSRATLMAAANVNESIMRKYFGWSPGSDQVKSYLHLSVKQLKDAILSMHGRKPKEEEISEPIKCICGSLNEPSERYCHKCFKPLKMETVVQDKELMHSEINKTVQFMMEMAKNPEMMKAFEEFKARVQNKQEGTGEVGAFQSERNLQKKTAKAQA